MPQPPPFHNLPRWFACLPWILLLAACGVSVTSLVPRQDDDPPDPPVDAGPAPRDGALATMADGGDGPDDDAPGEAPAAGLQIAGTWVPRERAIVLVHIGHSNMAGRGANPADLKPYFHDPHPNLHSYRFQDPIKASGPLVLVPATEPLAPDTATMGRAGPGMALLRAAQARAPDAHFISIGCGQSGAQYGLCESFKKGGLFYEHTMKPARMLKGKVTFGALFTMFGANEYWVKDTAGFADCLRQIALDVRQDLESPELPFIVGDYEMTAWGDYLPSLPGPSAVIAQLRLVPDKVPFAALIPTTELPLEDDHHFNLTGHKLWGERAIHILADRGWASWIAP